LAPAWIDTNTPQAVFGLGSPPKAPSRGMPLTNAVCCCTTRMSAVVVPTSSAVM